MFIILRNDVEINFNINEVSYPMLSRKIIYIVFYQLVPQTNTGRWGEYPKALERTQSKELCKLAP